MYDGLRRVSFKTRTEQIAYPALARAWQEADDIAALDVAWVYDHFIPAFGPADAPCLEGWTTLTALAAITERIRVGVMVSGNTYRHPAVLAKMAATVDRICDGRLEIGLGAGWNEREHAAYGIPLDPPGRRLDRLEEACVVIDGMLTSSPFRFEGEHYQVADAWCEPGPVQQPRPPLVIGGRGEKRTLRIAARWADQWNLPAGTPQELTHKLSVLHGHCHEVGRDPAEIEISVQIALDGSDTDGFLAEAHAMQEAGAQHVIIQAVPPFDMDAVARIAVALTES